MAVLTYILSQKYQETFLNKVNTELMNDVKDEDDHNDLISKFSKNCNIPTKENRFMNPLLTDYSNDGYLSKSCDSYNNKGIQREIEKNFTHDLEWGKEGENKVADIVEGDKT